MKNSIVLSAVVLMTALVLASFTQTFQVSDSEMEIKERWKSFIEHWEAEDAKGCAGFYFEDGVNIPQGLPEKNGRAEIEAFYNFLFTFYKSSTYTHTTHELYTSGNKAFEYGTFVSDWLTQDDEQFIYEARCMVHWEKADDGIWYIRRLLFNNPEQAD